MPLRIVDSEGRLLATFERQSKDVSFRLFNRDGIAVASLGIDGTEAGYLAIRNAEGKLLALIDVEAWGARVQLDGHKQYGGVTLFGGDGGEQAGGGIHIRHSAGGVSIALWSTPSGGELTMYDGQPQESLLSTTPERPSTQKDG